MSHRAVKSHRATIAALKRSIRLWRARGASFKADRLEFELKEEEAALGMAEAAHSSRSHSAAPPLNPLASIDSSMTRAVSRSC